MYISRPAVHPPPLIPHFSQQMHQHRGKRQKHNGYQVVERQPACTEDGAAEIDEAKLYQAHRPHDDDKRLVPGQMV